MHAFVLVIIITRGYTNTYRDNIIAARLVRFGMKNTREPNNMPRRLEIPLRRLYRVMCNKAMFFNVMSESRLANVTYNMVSGHGSTMMISRFFFNL